jgi:hypothetical protein
LSADACPVKPVLSFVSLGREEKKLGSLITAQFAHQINFHALARTTKHETSTFTKLFEFSFSAKS